MTFASLLSSMSILNNKIFKCLRFGGNVGHDAHLLYTLSAVQILALYDEMALLDKSKVTSFVASLQQPDGSFAGDKWGEVDTRFSYCALSVLSLLGELHSEAIDLHKAIDFVVRYRTCDTYRIILSPYKFRTFSYI